MNRKLYFFQLKWEKTPKINNLNMNRILRETRIRFKLLKSKHKPNLPLKINKHSCFFLLLIQNKSLIKTIWKLPTNKLDLQNKKKIKNQLSLSLSQKSKRKNKKNKGNPQLNSLKSRRTYWQKNKSKNLSKKKFLKWFLKSHNNSKNLTKTNNLLPIHMKASIQQPVLNAIKH